MKVIQMSDNKRGAKKRTYNTAPVETLLSALAPAAKGSLHVNGGEYRAVLAVDFGEALTGFRISSENLDSLKTQMRVLAREVIGRDSQLDILMDNSRGIMWVSNQRNAG